MLKRGLVRNGVLFARHVVPAAIRPARTLWNEMIGFLFGVFAVGIGFYCVDGMVHFRGDAGGFFRILLSGIFAAVMLFYGISSFLKARRISRS